MVKPREKNHKSNSLVIKKNLLPEPCINISIQISSDTSKTNQSLDSTRSVENISDSLEAVTLHKKTVPLNDNSSCSEYKDSPCINNFTQIIEPIQVSSTKMLDVNAEAFIPGFSSNKQNKLGNDVDIPILSNKVSQNGSTNSGWNISSLSISSNIHPEPNEQKIRAEYSGQVDVPETYTELHIKSTDAAKSRGNNTSTNLGTDYKEHSHKQTSSYPYNQNSGTSNLYKGDYRKNNFEQRSYFDRSCSKSYKKNDHHSSYGSSTQDMNNSFHQQSKKKYLDPHFERDRQGKNFTDNAGNDHDEELHQFHHEYKQIINRGFVKVVEAYQDLFAMPKDYALAHCVAEDMRMGSGIAVQFKKLFKNVDELLQQHAKQGSLATLSITTDTNNKRYIYYMVTKKLSNGKPTYDTFWSSLKEMRNHVRDNNVKKLAMPRIGCGLDRLDWTVVSYMIEFLFKNVDVDIVICNLVQNEENPTREHSYTDYSCKIVRKSMSVADIDPQTIIIYLTSEDGHVSDDMKKLAKKFEFKNGFLKAEKRLGECIKFKHRQYSLYGCIVRKTAKAEFDYLSFRKCLAEINRDNKKDLFEYVAMQEIKDENDPIINEKLITIMKYYLRKVEIYVCRDDDVFDQTPPRRQEKRTSVTSYDIQRSSNQISHILKTKNDYVLEKPYIDKEEHCAMSYANITNSSSDITSNDQTLNDTWDSKGDNSAIIDHNKSYEDDWNRSLELRRSRHQGKHNSIKQSTKRNSDHSVEENMKNKNITNNTEEEYQQFELYKQCKSDKFIKVIEIDQDLFAMPKDYSLAHCVAEDMSMGSGIAVHFKREFKRVDELQQQKVKQGGVAILNDNDDRYIYYLVTKRESTGKPTNYTIFSSLLNMRNHVRDNNVKKLAMPRIGCGLDRMEWSIVKLMIEFLFKDMDIEIMICNFQQSKEDPQENQNTFKIVHRRMSVANIEKYTMIIYLSTEDGHFSHDMYKLAKKFDFKNQFERAPKCLGDCIKFKQWRYSLYGCIVRKTVKSQFNFKSFKQCLIEINRHNRSDHYKYAAIQAVEDPTIMEELVKIMKDVLRDVEIHLCWEDSHSIHLQRVDKRASLEINQSNSSSRRKVMRALVNRQ